MLNGKPLCFDVYCGLGGWADGFLAEGWTVIGIDDGSTAPYATGAKYPGQLILMDALTVHGSMMRDADCIVCSPPCTKYSYLAMPWSRSKNPDNSKAAKALRRDWELNGPDNRLFDQCFRIQREASEAAGHYIPMIVENVRGAQPWVGRAAWSFGSFYLWADVPALMPIALKRGMKRNPDGTNHPKGSWFAVADSSQGDRREGQKVSVYSDSRRNGGKSSHLTCPEENADKLADGLKIGGDWFGDPNSTCRKHGSRSNARKMASAQIAKIPFELARHIAAVYYPRRPNK